MSHYFTRTTINPFLEGTLLPKVSWLVGSLVLGSAGLASMISRPAHAALSDDLLNSPIAGACKVGSEGAGKIPFICFDLAGGANIAGSNVLVGGQGGQEEFLSPTGYSRQGLPSNMLPSLPNNDLGTTDRVNRELGLAFHDDSAFLRGILERTSVATRMQINGAVIPARSENDTGNNPHNPMYGIYRAGADGGLLSLIGSRTSESGGNSMASQMWIDPSVRPTKIDRASDSRGLVDTGDLTRLMSQSDAVKVMESMYRLSDLKLDRLNPRSTNSERDTEIRTQVKCAYMKSAELADKYGDPSTLDPFLDDSIVGGDTPIFTADELSGDREFQKTASIMKLVIGGFAGAGTITMGGYDYHTGDRATGERRDLRAGRCMGACLEYAARMGKPLMMYVFSDGSVASNGRIDDSADGRGKPEWTGDNQATAASFFLVYNPAGRPVTIRNQIGYMSGNGNVVTSSSPAANNVNLLVNTVLLNYLALHDELGNGNFSNFESIFTNHGLGTASSLESLLALEPIV